MRAFRFASPLCARAFASAQNVATPRPDPIAILAAAKAASGGSAWDALRTQHSADHQHRRRQGHGGALGRHLHRPLADQVQHRAGIRRRRIRRQGRLVAGRFGPVACRDHRRRARTCGQRVLPRQAGVLVPGPAPRRSPSWTASTDEGAQFDVIRIVPEGGRAFQFWINTETHLIERLVEREADETRTEYLMDLRDVEGVKVPYRVRATRGDPRQDEVITIDKLDYNWPLTGVVFAQPVAAGPDFAFAGGAATVEVPFEVRNGHMFVAVMLNGKGPFRMLFDADRGNILAPARHGGAGGEAARAISAPPASARTSRRSASRASTASTWAAWHRRHAVHGDRHLRFIGRGSKASTSVAGVIGFEFFKRFPVKLDFQRSRATFYDPSRFTYAGGGTARPGHDPRPRGAGRGQRGRLQGRVCHRHQRARRRWSWPRRSSTRTGSSSASARRSRFVSGASGDGHTHALLARANLLKLGAVSVDRPVVALVTSVPGAATRQRRRGQRRLRRPAPVQHHVRLCERRCCISRRTRTSACPTSSIAPACGSNATGPASKSST